MNTQPRTILITGATEGIGKATATALAAQGHTIIVHGRNQAKLETLVSELQQTGNNRIEALKADFSSLREVRQMAEEFRQKHSTLDTLINNAALMASERTLSKDGFEMMLAVNHLAPFLLTHLLLPALQAAPKARIVNLSSVSYKTAKVNLDDFQCEQNFDMMTQYGNTKLYNLYFTLDLAEKLKNTNVSVNAAHPGGVRTQLARDFRGPLKWAFAVMMPLFFTSAEKGAETSVFLASSEQAEGITGKYFVKSKPETLLPIGENRELRVQVWKKSMEMTAQA